ncbi:hypothetical protein ACIBUY_02015 [Streptomyces sp. NPDC050085]|uniref:hypothetical protein n=1 Tax=Streptomyces sp. NPDC050085 TaxID=3365600 RepID=UPI0037A760B9
MPSPPGGAGPARRSWPSSGGGALDGTGKGVATLVRHDVPFIGIVAGSQQAVAQHEFARRLAGHGETVRAPRAIGPALRRARASGRPSLITVWVDPDAYAHGTTNQNPYE